MGQGRLAERILLPALLRDGIAPESTGVGIPAHDPSGLFAPPPIFAAAMGMASVKARF
jgi:hypothetical protein